MRDRKLPVGWRQVKLQDICTFQHGGTPSKNESSFWEGDIPWVSPKDMHVSVVENSKDRITYEAVEKSSTRLVYPGTILIVARSGILVRAFPIAVAGTELAFNQDIKALLPNRDWVDPQFLVWFLKSQEPYILMHGVKKGATVHSIRSGFLEGMKIELPPLNEQHRIAAILNEQMAAVEEARAAAEAELAAAEALPAAYLREVFESEEAQGWPIRQVKTFADVTGGIQKQPSRRPVDFHRPYLTVRNVQRGWLDLSHIENFEVTPEELERYRLENGDILIVEGNGSIGQIGRSAIFRSEIAECVHQNHVIRVRVASRQAIPRFVSLYLNSDLGKTQMVQKAMTTSGLYTLSVSKVKSLTVALPPVAEQIRVVQLVGEQMEVVEKTYAVLQEKLDLISKMPAALLRRAFNGEL
jgi:type I restriction enzyme S subunit